VPRTRPIILSPRNLPFLLTTMSSAQSSEMVAALVEQMRGREETDDR